MRRPFLIVRAESLLRFVMVKAFSRKCYVVTEYPKSGGTWVSQMLSDYLEVPFPRNRFPEFRKCIIHGHYRYSPGMRNVFVVLRDGRDIMVSFYYHSLFINDRYNEDNVEKVRRDLPFADYNDIRENLPSFIEYVFLHEGRYRLKWNQFIRSWSGQDAAFIKYENLLLNPVDELSSALEKVCNCEPDRQRLKGIVERYSFKSQTGRDPGEEGKESFLRKGIAGDWKNHFTKNAREVFDNFAGSELVSLGYEKDRQWVYKNTF
jgi:hypothetical protein